MSKIIFDPHLFSKELPEEVQELTLFVMRKGFSLTLIGGAPRDFLRSGKLGKDFDFELKHSMPFSEKEWESRLKLLKKDLSKNYSVEVLSFQILRINIGDYEVEFSSARQEIYRGDGPFNHSDFEVILSPSLSSLESIERRDFTLNSIGIHFGALGTDEEFVLVDPLNGITSLVDKKLEPIRLNFYKDPVRMLRAIRFHLKYSFEFSNIDFAKFDLSYLTIHWLVQEAKKSKTTRFFSTFFQKIDQYKVKINDKTQMLSVLGSIGGHDWDGDTEQLLYLLLEAREVSEKKDFLKVSELLSINKQFSSSLWDIFFGIESQLPLDKKKLQLLSDVDFAKSTEFKIVKSLHQFFSRFPQVFPLFLKGSHNSYIESVFQICLSALKKSW